MILATFLPDLSAGMAAYERILDIIDAEPTVQQNPGAHIVNDLNGEIAYEVIKIVVASLQSRVNDQEAHG